MKAVLQRVSSASVRIGDEVVGKIGQGLAVLLGVVDGDGVEEAVAFFQHRFKRMGVDTALEKAGARDGDEVRILGFSFAFESPTAGAVDVYQELDI